MRIIEIGAAPCFKLPFFKETVHFSTMQVSIPDEPDAGLYSLSLRTLPILYRALREPADLIVCQPTTLAPWQLKWIGRTLFHRRTLKGQVPLLRPWGPQLLRLKLHAPLAIMDLEDSPIVNRSAFFLMDRCHTYFKRELPTDYWRLFMSSGHSGFPTPRFRRNQRNAARLKKVRPLSLGLPHGAIEALPGAPRDKTTDIFFAGRVEGMTVRERGLPELLALRDKGVKVDIPDEPLPRKEFYERCAQAWLVWSPEGYGWQCFRHYEALGCRSVPVINQPTIQQAHRLRDGQYALFYDVEPGDLTRVVTAALADKNRLAAIARTGRDHVMTFHTPRAMAEYVLKMTLGSKGPC